MKDVMHLPRRLARAGTLALLASASPLWIGAQQPAQPTAVPDGKQLTLQEAITIAQQRGHAAEAARSARDASRQRDRAFNARLLPQFAVTGDAMNLNRGIIPITQPDGQKFFINQSQNESKLGLGITQQLPWTGGQLSVGSRLSRIDQFGDTKELRWQTTPLVIELRQDLLRPRRLVWDQRQQDANASLAERQYLEAREDVAANTAAAFFDYYAAQIALENAITNVAVNDTLYTLNKGRYEVGKIGENDLLQSELSVLRVRASLDGARLERDRTEAALKRLLNMRGSDTLRIAAPDVVPAFAIDPDVAVQQAMRNSSVLEQSELEELIAKRRETEARLNNRFNASIVGSFGFNQTSTVFDQAYESPLGAQTLQLSLNMPLMQWGGGRADVQAAKAEEMRVAANTRARQEQLQEDARFAALQLTQSQRMVAISAKADTVASKRFEVAKNRYVIGKIGISDLYIAMNEKDQALQAYIQALRGYWTAYYRLRRVTLYDFETGKVLD